MEKDYDRLEVECSTKLQSEAVMGHITFQSILLGFDNSHTNVKVLLQCLATIVTADAFKQRALL